MRHCLMKRYFHIAIISLACCLTAACGDNTPVVELTQDNSTLVKENMINANRVVIQSEATQIESYVNRRGWKMKPLPRHWTAPPSTPISATRWWWGAGM